MIAGDWRWKGALLLLVPLVPMVREWSDSNAIGDIENNDNYADGYLIHNNEMLQKYICSNKEIR